MNHRHLGKSGLMVSEISYGNWLTHGAQVEKEGAFACVRAALDEGITTFDTADVYAQTRAEEVLGEALEGQRRTGKYLPGQPPPQGSRATDQRGSQMIAGFNFMSDDVLTRVQKLKPIAQEAGLSLAQLAVAWVLQNPGVSSAIIGASRPEQVRDNVKASGVKVDASVMKQIDEVLGTTVVRDPAKTVSPAKRP